MMFRGQEQLPSILLEKWKTDDAGQSILEVIVAMAIFALIGGALVSLVVGSFTGLQQGGEQTEAEALAQEGLEAVKAVRDRAWNEYEYTQSNVEVLNGEWVLSGEGTTETIGQYTRTITFADVCRDTSDDIATCPATYTDVHTKEVTVDVTWNPRTGITNSVQKVGYVTNWDSKDWVQTGWSGGSGQTTWSDITRHNTDDGNLKTNSVGQVTLLSSNIQDSGFSLPVGTTVVWPFTTSSSYTFDVADIQVTGGVAKLVSSGGSSSSGSTTNDTFSSNSTGWTFNMWDAGPDEVDPTGSWVSSGGNPDGYINIDIPSNATGDEVGGYWEQSISITENGAEVTCSFDWSIVQWVTSSGVNDYQVYVFLDSVTGAPTIGNEIWSSGTQSGPTSWTTEDIDCSSAATTSGTYYYKIAVWVEAKNSSTGPITLGYDTAKVEWSLTSGGSFPTDEPSIFPVNSKMVPGITSWTSFTETASKNGGEIYYQLTNDNGTTWKYWNGSSWVTAGAASYNTASVINANIGSFPITNQQIKFRAFLESNGTQDVRLDNLSIGFVAPSAAWSFATWGVGGGEVTPTGAVFTSGGNPEGYVNIRVPRGSGDEIGGYWQQAFTTYKDNPIGDNLNFDYKIIDFNDSPLVAHIRVYIDASGGTPVNQVGSSISFSGEGAWTAASQIDTSSSITTAATYYLKIAVWMETPTGGGPNATGPFEIGFDNIALDLGDGEYVTAGMLTSSSFDMADISKVQVVEWDETTPSGTDVTIDVSTAPDSGGSPGTWSTWETAATSTGTLLPTSLNDDQWVRYRANLTGDGSETPILEEVRINYK